MIFFKSVLRKTAEFSVRDTGDPLILTCLPTLLHFLFAEAKKDEGTEKAARRQKREQRKKVLEKTQELSQKFGTLRSTGKIERLVSRIRSPKYSKFCVKQPLKSRQNKDLNGNW